jgi:hypothetical protein
VEMGVPVRLEEVMVDGYSRGSVSARWPSLSKVSLRPGRMVGSAVQE